MSITATAPATVSSAPFGSLADGTKIDIYTLASPDITVRIATYGARVISLESMDRDGNMADIVLGHNTLEDYVRGPNACFGAIAGRYANRIGKGKFSLDGHSYQITINDGPNALHGGIEGFDSRVWTGREIPDGVEFSLVSADGDQGFPGTLTAHARYTLNGNRLLIEVSATTDKHTVVNLINHTYFNLSGEGNPSIVDTVVTLNADKFALFDETLIPTGEIVSVVGTPFDFTEPTRVGDRIDVENKQLEFAWGYDQTFVLRGNEDELRPAATAFDPASGRVLEVSTTQPAVHFYSGNHLTGELVGKTGARYIKRSGFCFETQHFPDSPNHPNFPSTELKPGQTFHHTTEYVFSAKK